MNSNMFKKFNSLLLVSFVISSLAGCAITISPPNHHAYDAYKQSSPRSIIVLPPINESPDVKATYSFYSQVTLPLAESGYYVFPVALVDETFKQNGLDNPVDIQATSPQKIQAIFGADAGLYITVTKYGSSYTIINSVSVVSANAKLVDLRTGEILWTGMETASDNEGSNEGGGNLIGLLIASAVKQIISNLADTSHPVAGITSYRLLMAKPNGLLYGPYSPNYIKN
jgi:hypothetical protein